MLVGRGLLAAPLTLRTALHGPFACVLPKWEEVGVNRERPLIWAGRRAKEPHPEVRRCSGKETGMMQHNFLKDSSSGHIVGRLFPQVNMSRTALYKCDYLKIVMHMKRPVAPAASISPCEATEFTLQPLSLQE